MVTLSIFAIPFDWKQLAILIEIQLLLSLLQNCLQNMEKRQGTTSVVPQMQQNKCRALAPEGCFHPDLPESASFSATSSVVP
jgi:hypothetical protein